MKHLLQLLAVIVAVQVIIICTGCGVDENAKYRDGCKYCGLDGFIGEDDIQHAKSEGPPDAAQWKVGLCPYCQTGKNLLASTAPPPQQARPAPVAAPTSAPPLPAPTVKLGNNMAPQYGVPGLVDGFVYNNTSHVLRSATVIVQGCTDTGQQLESYTLFVSYVDPGSSAYFKTRVFERMATKTVAFVSNYRYAD